MVPGQLARFVTPVQEYVLGAAYCCILAEWLGWVVPHLEQPSCISSSVSGLLSKGDQGAEKDALLPGLIPKAAGREAGHSPWRPGGTHHPTMQAQLSSELSAWCWTLCLAFYPDQQFTDTVTWFLPLLHCPGAWMLPWFSGTHNPSLQTDSFFFILECYVWGRQSGVPEVFLCSPPSLPFRFSAVGTSLDLLPQMLLRVSTGSLREEVVNGGHRGSEEAWKWIQTARSFLFPRFHISDKDSIRIHITHKIKVLLC